ncbi:Protein phosphatase 1 regulatory subunit 3C, partial [Aphelenchoides avenae]
IVGIYEKSEERLRIFDSGHSHPPQRILDLLMAAVTTLRPDVPGLAPFKASCKMQPFSLYNRQFDSHSCGFFAALYCELYLLHGADGTFIQNFDVNRHRRRMVRLIADLQRGGIPDYEAPQANEGSQECSAVHALSDLIEKAASNKVALESWVVRGQLLTGRVMVRNLAYHKRVFIRSSSDGCQNFLDWEAVFASSPVEGYDAFRFETALPADADKVEFRVGYSVDGMEYWDSNGDQSYEVIPPKRPSVPQGKVAAASSRTKATGTLEMTLRVMQQEFEIESIETELAVDFTKATCEDLARKGSEVLGDREGVSFESVATFDAAFGEYAELDMSEPLVPDENYIVNFSFDPSALQD